MLGRWLLVLGVDPPGVVLVLWWGVCHLFVGQGAAGGGLLGVVLVMGIREGAFGFFFRGGVVVIDRVPGH